MRKLFIILIPFLCILLCIASCNQVVNDILDSSEIISAEFTDSNYDTITVHYSRVPSNPSVKVLIYKPDGTRNGSDSSQTQVMKKSTVTLTNEVPPSGWAVIGAADGNDSLFGSITLSRP